MCVMWGGNKDAMSLWWRSVAAACVVCVHSGLLHSPTDTVWSSVSETGSKGLSPLCLHQPRFLDIEDGPLDGLAWTGGFCSFFVGTCSRLSLDVLLRSSRYLMSGYSHNGVLRQPCFFFSKCPVCHMVGILDGCQNTTDELCIMFLSLYWL